MKHRTSGASLFQDVAIGLITPADRFRTKTVKVHVAKRDAIAIDDAKSELVAVIHETGKSK